MKICFSTLGCPEWSWDRIVEQAAKLGYDGLELRGIEGEMHLPKARPFTEENIKSTIAQLKDSNLKISCLGTSTVFHDKDKWQENVDAAKEHIDLAAKLEAPFIRVFGDKIPDPAHKDEVIAQVVKGLEELGQYARGTGVRVVVETHGDFSRSSDLKLVLDKVTMPEIGVLWDMHHPYRFYDEPLDETMGVIGERIYHTHVKDSQMVDGNMQYCLVGDGDMPLKDCLQLLVERDYDGWVSLEWEKKWHPHLDEPEVAFPHFMKVVKGIIREIG